MTCSPEFAGGAELWLDGAQKEDLVERWGRIVRENGLDVTYVRNITDVDDKILKRAAEVNLQMARLTAPQVRLAEKRDRLPPHDGYALWVPLAGVEVERGGVGRCCRSGGAAPQAVG